MYCAKGTALYKSLHVFVLQMEVHFLSKEIRKSSCTLERRKSVKLTVNDIRIPRIHCTSVYTQAKNDETLMVWCMGECVRARARTGVRVGLDSWINTDAFTSDAW